MMLAGKGVLIVEMAIPTDGLAIGRTSHRHVACHNLIAFLSEGYSYDGGSRLEVPLRQFSSALMVEVPLYGGIIKVVPSLYYDRGEVLGENIAAILFIKYSFVKPD